MNILHITHTDINSDSRILKEMHTIAKANGSYIVNGIGVTRDEGVNTTDEDCEFSTYSIVLKSRKLKFLPTVIWHIFAFIELVFKVVYKAIKLKPGVIHCHDVLVLPSCAIIKIFTGAKLIYDAHELESDKNGLTKTMGSITLFVEKVLWKLINALIVVSPSINKWYKENIGEKYTEIILNSPVIKKDKSYSDKSYLRKKFSISDDSTIFIYLGFLCKGRGIDLITEAFKDSNINSSVIFIGYGPLSVELRELAEKYTNIYVHDAVPHEQVVSIAKSADVGLCLIQNVSLSDYYCLPNKLFEYCFAEIPVLASDFPDISKTVARYKLGKCCELNIESVREAIKEFEALPELPHINVDDLYELSWGAQEQKLIKLYSNVIK